MAYGKINTYDRLMKILTIGDSGVGKSSLISRFVDDTFDPRYLSTIGIDFKVRTIQVGTKRIKIHIWDTAGQERFRTVMMAYYRGAHGILLVYDITSRKSFESMAYWVKSIENHASEDVSCALIGNKCDDEEHRVVTTKEGKDLADRIHATFHETSAKAGTEIENAIVRLAAEVTAITLEPREPNTFSVVLHEDTNGSSACSC